MNLFKSDLLRSFAIGFALGAVVVFSSVGSWASDGLGDNVVPAAVAAPVN